MGKKSHHHLFVIIPPLQDRGPPARVTISWPHQTLFLFSPISRFSNGRVCCVSKTSGRAESFAVAFALAGDFDLAAPPWDETFQACWSRRNRLYRPAIILLALAVSSPSRKQVFFSSIELNGRFDGEDQRFAHNR